MCGQGNAGRGVGVGFGGEAAGQLPQALSPTHLLLTPNTRSHSPSTRLAPKE